MAYHSKLADGNERVSKRNINFFSTVSTFRANYTQRHDHRHFFAERVIMYTCKGNGVFLYLTSFPYIVCYLKGNRKVGFENVVHPNPFLYVYVAP